MEGFKMKTLICIGIAVAYVSVMIGNFVIINGIVKACEEKITE